MVANEAAARGGKSSPSHGPATPRTSTVKTVLTSISSSWILRLAANRDARTPMAMTAKVTPAPKKPSSSPATFGGRPASQRRKPMAPMMAAAAIPLTTGRRQVRSGWPAAAQAPGIRPNALSAGIPADVFLSADTYRHAQIGCTGLLTTWNHNVRDPSLLRARNSRLTGPRRRYLADLAFGRWGTERLSGARRVAWSGRGLLAASPSAVPRFRRPAAACSVRSLVR